MNIDEKIKELEQKFNKYCDEINTEISALKEPVKPEIKDPIGSYRPPVGGKYWCITTAGSVVILPNLNSPDDIKIQKYGNSFETYGQATHRLSKYEAIGELKRAIKEINAGEVVDWSNHDQKKYFLNYDHSLSCFTKNWYYATQSLDSELYCLHGDKLIAWATASKESAMIAIGVI